MIISDVFTKALQGASFLKIKDIVIRKISINQFSKSYESKVRVEDNNMYVSVHELKKFLKENESVTFSFGNSGGR